MFDSPRPARGATLVHGSCLAACAALLIGCPEYGPAERLVGPPSPVVTEPEYACMAPNGLPCEPPRARFVLRGWSVSRIDAHDGVVAFTGRRLGPSGADADELMRVGRIDVEHGSVLWTAPIGLRNYDASQADLHVADGGDILIAFAGSGEAFTGVRTRDKGFVARFAPDGKTRFVTELHVDDDPPGQVLVSEFKGLTLAIGKYAYVIAGTERETYPGAYLSRQRRSLLYALAPDGRVVWQRTLESRGPMNQGAVVSRGGDRALWITYGEREIRRYTAEGELDYEGRLPEGHKLGWSAAFGERQLLVSATHPVAAPGGTGGQFVLHDAVMSFEPGKAPAVLSDLPRDKDHPPPALWRWNHRGAWLVDWVNHPTPGEARVRALDAHGGTEIVRVTPLPSWLAFPGDGEMIHGRVLFSQQRATEIIVQPLRSQAVRAVP